jgi:hypothetical protein
MAEVKSVKSKSHLEKIGASTNFSPGEHTNKLCEFKPEKDPLVRGVFENVEIPGLSLQFSFRAYKGKIERYKFEEGESYTVPLSVAKHIDEMRTIVDSNLMDASGRPYKVQGKGQRRFSFRITEYL